MIYIAFRSPSPQKETFETFGKKCIDFPQDESCSNNEKFFLNRFIVLGAIVNEFSVWFMFRNCMRDHTSCQSHLSMTMLLVSHPNVKEFQDFSNMDNELERDIISYTDDSPVSAPLYFLPNIASLYLEEAIWWKGLQHIRVLPLLFPSSFCLYCLAFCIGCEWNSMPRKPKSIIISWPYTIFLPSSQLTHFGWLVTKCWIS